MGKELLSNLLIFNVLVFAALSAFSQQIDKVVGKYYIPNDIKNSCEYYNERYNTLFEDYSIEFYPNHKFKYYNESGFIYGPYQTQGVWKLSGDTIILDSGIKELSMESFGCFEYPFNKYTFKIFELSKGCTNWFHKAHEASVYNFLTVNGDTIKLHPDENGLISFGKDTVAISIWGHSIFRETNKVDLQADKKLNFYIVKCSYQRQFAKEKWIFRKDGTIIPVDRQTNELAYYTLVKDDKWDANTKWTEAWTPELDKYRKQVCLPHENTKQGFRKQGGN